MTFLWLFTRMTERPGGSSLMTYETVATPVAQSDSKQISSTSDSQPLPQANPSLHHPQPVTIQQNQLQVSSEDFSKTQTEPQVYELDGFKWFTSATDGDFSIALAKVGGKDDKGRDILKAFLIPMKLNGKPNGLSIHRLKVRIPLRLLVLC
jgi:hypothetical protein